VPEAGFYREIINTDAETYGGSNVGNMGGLDACDEEWQGRTHSLMIEVPPLATIAFKLEPSNANQLDLAQPSSQSAESATPIASR
jgi:1,4-alpha-glucan branching enzyme